MAIPEPEAEPEVEAEAEAAETAAAKPPPFTTLVLGGEVDVPTLGRPVRMKVPPTTANGCSFRLARLGMPHLSADGRGDLVVRVNTVLPHQISDRERRLFEELRALASD